MNTYILILLIIFPGEYSSTVNSIEFSNQETCSIAAAAYHNRGLARDKTYEDNRFRSEINAQCFKK